MAATHRESGCKVMTVHSPPELAIPILESQPIPDQITARRFARSLVLAVIVSGAAGFAIGITGMSSPLG